MAFRLFIVAGLFLALITNAQSADPVAQNGAANSGAKLGLSASWPISPKVKSTLVTFPTAGGKRTLTVPARFNMPIGATSKVPAVVYVHGTPGPDGRGPFNAWSLNEAGIATLEIDMWAAAGVKPGSANREQLGDRMSFVYGALLFLEGQPAIDPARIGIEGESMGGGVTLASTSMRALRSHTDGTVKFAAHLAFYPPCSTFLNKIDLGKLTGAPIYILIGDQDPNAPDCRMLAEKIGAGLTVYPGATHQWDGQEGKPETFYDPDAFGGKGGQVHVVPSPETAEKSRAFGVEFFSKAFGMP